MREANPECLQRMLGAHRPLAVHNRAGRSAARQRRRGCGVRAEAQPSTDAVLRGLMGEKAPRFGTRGKTTASMTRVIAAGR